jgi:hypothetical protein
MSHDGRCTRSSAIECRTILNILPNYIIYARKNTTNLTVLGIGLVADIRITACTVVQCSVMDDSALQWEHAIFGPPPHRNPLTDRYEILHY